MYYSKRKKERKKEKRERKKEREKEEKSVMTKVNDLLMKAFWN